MSRRRWGVGSSSDDEEKASDAKAVLGVMPLPLPNVQELRGIGLMGLEHGDSSFKANFSTDRKAASSAAVEAVKAVDPDAMTLAAGMASETPGGGPGRSRAADCIAGWPVVAGVSEETSAHVGTGAGLVRGVVPGSLGLEPALGSRRLAANFLV